MAKEHIAQSGDKESIDLTNLDMVALAKHAALTIKTFENLSKRRSSWSTKEWERKLAYSAYRALGRMPKAGDVLTKESYDWFLAQETADRGD